MLSRLLSILGSRDDGGGAYALGFLNLRFRSPAVERAYTFHDLQKALPLVRLTLGFAILVYGSFAILDYKVAGNALLAVLLIRWGIVCPVMLIGLLTTFSRRFHEFAQLMLGLCMTTAGLGIIGMTAVLPPPYNGTYYAGLILVVIYGSTLVRMKFTNSLIISALLVAAYQVVATRFNPLPHSTLLSNDFFLIVATMLGLFGSYIQELYVRWNFVSTRLLTAETKRSQLLLEKSEAANHAKSEFLAVVSHELRTPLNAIIGFSEFLKMEMLGPLGSDRYKSYVEDIHQSGEHLLQIINDILDLSRAEANKLDLSEETFELAPAVESCLRMFRNKAGEAGVRLAHHFDDTPLVHADRRLIRQVVINLLSNAIKFTPKGGAVTLGISVGGDGWLSIRVADTGIGIAPDDIPRVLEPFAQVESAIARSHEGLGLGLPLVKRIMEIHGGEISITSELGKGATVTVTLPPPRVLEVRADPRHGRAANDEG